MIGILLKYLETLYSYFNIFNLNMSMNEMYVIKRSGAKEEVSFDKILKRLKILGAEAGLTNVNYSSTLFKK